MVLYLLLCFLTVPVQETGSNAPTARDAETIVRDAPVFSLAEALQSDRGKSELVKLAAIFVEQLPSDDNAADESGSDEISLIAYTHALTNDLDRDGKRPALTLMAKEFDQKTDQIIEPLGTSFSAPTVYMKKLPAADAVANYTTIEQLEETFGPDRGWTSGWGSGDTMNYTNSWLVFQPNNDGGISTLSVFARLSRQLSTGKISVRSIDVSSKTFRVLPASKRKQSAENAK